MLIVFRVVFLVVVLAVLFVNITTEKMSSEENSASFWMVVLSGFGMAVFVLLLDVLTPKKKLSALAGVFFGLFIGMLISVVAALVVDMIADSYRINLIPDAVSAIKWMLGICICFLVISIVMRTKDDVRFVIPYVEFAKQTKGARPLVLDTSAIVDGRIADLYQSKLFDAPLIVPRFVLNELQLIADSADRLKRNRGRRGLDILNRMQTNSEIDVEIDDTVIPEAEDVKGVDQKLIMLPRTATGDWRRLTITSAKLRKCARLMY